MLPETLQLARIDDYLLHYAKITPNNIAIVFEERDISYAQLAADVERCAAALAAAGVSHQDRIAVLCTPRPEHFVMFLAANRLGAIWIGLNPRSQLPELQYVLSDSRPKVLVSITNFEGRNYVADLKALRSEFSFITSLVTIGEENSDGTRYEDFIASSSEDTSISGTPLSATDTALIVYTSGTTGKPKGVMLRHREVIARVLVRHRRMPTERPRVINFFPVNHMASICFVSLHALLGGGTIHFLDRFDAVAIPRIVEERKINILLMMPTIYQMICQQEAFDRYDLSTLEWIIWTGGTMPLAVVEKLAKTGAKLAATYGMTETAGGTVFANNDEVPDLAILCRIMGRPDPVDGVRIASADGGYNVPGSQGEIQVHPRAVMNGYFGKPDATTDAFTADGWFRTGDVALIREDGNLAFVGRMSDMYKSGGYNIYPREIELVLEQHASVTTAAVVGVTDELYGEVGHAFIVLKAAKSVEESELRELCKQKLANYKTPKHITFLDELPLLPVGKVDKLTLKRNFSSNRTD